jgi:hypothetical protein
MARPTKLSEEVEKAICDAIEAGSTYAAAAEAAGIAVSTFNDWLKDERPRFVQFSEAVRRANARFMTEGLRRIKEAGRKDWRAIAWSLERRLPEYFGQQSKVEVNHNGNLEIGIKQIDYRNGISIPATRSGDDSSEPS